MIKTMKQIIVESMTEEEVRKILKDIRTDLSIRMDGWTKKYKKMFRKSTDKSILIQTYKHNLNTTIFVHAEPTALYVDFEFSFIVKVNGKSLLYKIKKEEKSELSIPRQVIMEIYTSHFFARYRDRKKIEKTGEDLILHFIENDIMDFSATQTLIYEGKEQVFSVFRDGVSLCDLTGQGMRTFCHHNTFLTIEMLKEDQDRVTKEIANSNALMQAYYKANNYIIN